MQLFITLIPLIIAGYLGKRFAPQISSIFNLKKLTRNSFILSIIMTGLAYTTEFWVFGSDEQTKLLAKAMCLMTNYSALCMMIFGYMGNRANESDQSRSQGEKDDSM